MKKCMTQMLQGFVLGAGSFSLLLAVQPVVAQSAANPPYLDTSLTPEQILQLTKQLKDANTEIAGINGEKAVLQRSYAKVKAELAKILGPDPDIKLPADLKGKILVVDPKWDFVVLNIGDEQGVIPDGEMLVSREGKLVAKVVISSVQKDRCIANVMPGWKLGEVFEGDEVTPAHPAS